MRLTPAPEDRTRPRPRAASLRVASPIVTWTRRLTGLEPAPAAVGLAVVVLCATSVGALVADLYGVMAMGRFVLFVTVPALVVVSVIGLARVPAWSDLQRRIAVGAVAGFVGTVGYDVFRIPFALAGQRIFAPIDSYGLLIDGGPMSSGWTDLLGWGFHFSNGITFGIAYAIVLAGRHWGWGVAYGMGLEAVAFLSPFTETYGLSGKVWPIVIAFAAHVAYGLPLGLMVQRLDDTDVWLRDRFRAPAVTSIVLVLVVLLVWHRPWDVSDALETSRSLSDELGIPATVVTGSRFEPEWLRVEPGGCILVASISDESFTSDYGDLPAGEDVEWCFPDEGVQRVKLGDRPYSGGFVYVHEG
jgi:hypothetical protein